MCIVMSSVNQKGGIGKTNVTLNLGIGLVNAGKKVLLIDTDPQGSLTNNLGFTASELTNTLATVYNKLIDPDFDEDINVDDYILHHKEGVDLVPSNIELSSSEFNLPQADLREFQLKIFIQELKDRYDYIIIDCPPSLALLTVNALCASDEVIIPITATKECYDMIEPFSRTYKRIRKKLNPSLRIKGFIYTMYIEGRILTDAITERFENSYGEHFRFFTPIPMAAALSECSLEGISIYQYRPRSKAEDARNAYLKLVEEILE